MRLTSKGRFAVTAMLDLALNQNNGIIVTLASIGQRQNLSPSYLEQIFNKLKKSGLVKSRRGPGGGYIINAEVHKISVRDIIVAVDEKIDNTSCGGSGRCTETVMPSGHCITHHLWDTLNSKILDFLSAISLQDLVDHVLHNQPLDCATQPVNIAPPKTRRKNLDTDNQISKLNQLNQLKPAKQVKIKVPIINSIFNFVSVPDNNEGQNHD
jgi:Rrf2 family transcriptional regulator, iron-sulfur cluster assembly transcription factor